MANQFSDFKPGMRVQLVAFSSSNNQHPDLFTVGTVVYADGTQVSVEWDVVFPGGHGCNGDAKDGRGRFYYSGNGHNEDWNQSISQIEPIFECEEKPIEEADELLDFLDMIGGKTE